MANLIRLICLTLCFSFLSGCYERHQWRQKLTIVVETPSGEVTGSSVVQVNANYYGQLPGTGTEVEYWISGEAAAVHLGSDQYVFVLLDSNEELVYLAAKDRFQGMQRQDWLHQVALQELPIVVQPDTIPPMVAFLDAKDPSSLRNVMPDSFDQVFGQGYHLKKIILEVTDDPVGPGVLEGLLDWWLTDRAGPRDQMVSLRLPDDSPRGWTDITSASFWSLDLRQQLNERYK